MTVREVGGCLIDLTRRDRQSDQLSAFYPGGQLRDLKFAGIEVEAPTIYEAAELDRVFVRARRVTLRLVATPAREGARRRGRLHPRGRLALRAGDHHLRQPRYDAGRRRAARRDPRRSHVRVTAPTNAGRAVLGLRQAFRPGLRRASPRGTRSSAPTPGSSCSATGTRDGKVAVRLAPGESYRLTRRVIPGANLFDVRRGRRPASPARPTMPSALVGEGHGGPARRRGRRGPRPRRQAACLGPHRPRAGLLDSTPATRPAR